MIVYCDTHRNTLLVLLVIYFGRKRLVVAASKGSTIENLTQLLNSYPMKINYMVGIKGNRIDARALYIDFEEQKTPAKATGV